MKTETPSGSLSSIKTAVFYRWNKYLPTNAGALTSCYDKFLKDYSSTEVFYLSSGSSSDYLAFSEYDFMMKPEVDSYRSFVKSNYFDTETLDLVRNDNGYNYEALRWLDKSIFPQLSNEDPQFISSGNNFFGMVSKGSQSFVLLDIDGEDRSENNVDEIIKPGIWKVELYSESINSNHNLGEKYSGFIEYDVLSALEIPDVVQPSLVITFGPSSSAVKNPDQMYYSWQELGTITPPNYLPKTEDTKGWLSLCREISSRKVLYIIISSLGEIEAVNLSYISWELSQNPNRNQNEYSLRNDNFWRTRDSIEPFENSSTGNFIYDKNSGVVLGTNLLSELQTPILEKKIKRLKDRFHPRKVYSLGDVVSLKDTLYVSAINGNLGEIPGLSGKWLKLDSTNSDLLNDKKESLKTLKDQLVSKDFLDFYIHTNDKTVSKIFPIGSLSYRDNFRLNIDPIPGYEISEIRVNSENNDDLKNNLTLDPQTGVFSVEINVGDLKKEYSKVDLEIICKEAEKSCISIEEISYTGMYKDLASKLNTISYITGQENSLESISNVLISVYPGNYIDGELVWSEESLAESKDRPKTFEFEKSVEAIKLRVDFRTSQLELVSVDSRIPGEEKETLDQLETNHALIREYLVKGRNENGEAEEFTAKEIYLNTVDKQLEVTVSSELYTEDQEKGNGNIDVSSYGGYVIYGDKRVKKNRVYNYPFQFNFTVKDPEFYAFRHIRLEIPGTTEVFEFSSLGEGIEFKRDDSFVNAKVDFLYQGGGIYSLGLYEITNDCKVTIVSRLLN
jgi:hypothetical protein